MTRRLPSLRTVVLGLAVAAAGVTFFLVRRPLSVVIVQPEDATVEVFGLGTVEARIVARVGFEVGGALLELAVDHGDRVRKGDVLARLNAAAQQARAAEAAAGVLAAEATWRRSEAAAEKAAAVLEQKRRTNARARALLKQRTVSAEAADDAQTEEDVAAADLRVALREIDVHKAELEDARARSLTEAALLAQYTLRAPFDAIVVERLLEPGTVLTPGAVLFTLVDPATYWMLAHVDESRAGDIRVGQSARIRLRSMPRDYAGHVTRIALESDRVSEERRVFVVCDDCPRELHLGEQAEVLITTDLLEQALLVPEAAVDGFDGARGTVWTIEQGRLQRRTIAFAQRTLDARLAVGSALPDGAEIVAKPLPGFREGRAARSLQDASR
jgi:HlyD family secretion protein